MNEILNFTFFFGNIILMAFILISAIANYIFIKANNDLNYKLDNLKDNSVLKDLEIHVLKQKLEKSESSNELLKCKLQAAEIEKEHIIMNNNLRNE